MRVPILLACLFLCACTQRFYELGVALPEPASDPDAGTSMQAVLGQMGPPHRLTRTVSGWTLGWEYWRVSQRAVGIGGVAGLDALSFDWGDARVRGDFLLVSFDLDRQASTVSRASWDNKTAGGASVQPFFGLLPLVDVADLLLPLPQHNWGASALTPLPTALNNENRPGMGSNGLEQRGTPTGIGQRSLEILLPWQREN